MSIGSVQFHSSAIEDQIYKILDSNPCYICVKEVERC